MPLLIGLGMVGFMLLVWGIAKHNRLVALRSHIRESWSDIDVELKRRYELIPNLVATVKGYATHERQTLESLMELRRAAMASGGPADRQAVDESRMLRGLGQVFAVAEDYPELKADRNFLSLQRELALTEDRIAASRRFYNGNVRDMRQLVQMFPSSLIARMFGFEGGEYFQLDSEAERVVPRVEL